jgi:hypothetical protein
MTHNSSNTSDKNGLEDEGGDNSEAGAESVEEGQAAMAAADDAVIDDASDAGKH